MSDITCSKCGEPWDSYGISLSVCRDGKGDVSIEEARRFHAGHGCPACGFGQRCPSCNGTGGQSDARCPHGCRNAKLMAWQPQSTARGFVAGQWYHGYAPNTRPLPDGARKLRSAGNYRSADGYVNQAWYACPHCLPAAGPVWKCDECDGDGKLHRHDAADIELDALRSAIDASDEDPILIMSQRGF